MPTVSTRAQTAGFVVSEAEPVVLAVANDSREAVVIHNAVGKLYVKCGQNASNSDYTYCMTAGSTLEISRYIGPISAVASQATYVRVTELI